MRWPSVLPALLLVAVGACGGGDGSEIGEVVTGRVMSLTPARACVSPDRGETETCVARSVAPADVEVGQCATVLPAPTPEAAELDVVDDAACATGDLGD